MTLTERFQLALQSHLGPLLIGLLCVLSILGGLYWWLIVRQRQRDLLAYWYRTYYERALELVKTLSFQGGHKADFFGRQTAVRLAEGEHGLCLIPPPDLVDDNVCDRFRCFWRATHFQQLPLFSHYIWKHDDEGVLVVVQDQLLDRKGKRLLNLKHFLTDKRLLPVDREEILLEVARALSRLHDLHAEFGGHIYHGFLLPRSIALDLDSGNRVHHLTISDVGLAFAFGPEKLCERLEKLRAGKLPIERYCGHELLDQMAHLAPEQRESRRLHEVGPACDFYAFGALAVSLFSRQRFTSREMVKWNLVPEKWRPFIEACLSDSPCDRPHDFLELEDWLSDPELALTHQEVQKAPAGDVVTPSTTDVGSLSAMLERVQTHEKEEIAEGLSDILESAEKAIHSARWKNARKQLEKALQIDPNHAQVHVLMAIACLEIGDEKAAERHYHLAKQINPRLAKRFREHLAFKM